MIEIIDLREEDCTINKVDADGFIDILIEEKSGNIYHMMLTTEQYQKIMSGGDEY